MQERKIFGVNYQSCADMSESIAIYTSCRNARGIFHSCWLEQWKAGGENVLMSGVFEEVRRTAEQFSVPFFWSVKV